MEELHALSQRVSVINSSYARDALSPGNIKNKTKLEILQLIEQKENEIKNVIDNSNISDLYKIINLSTEYISPIIKKKLNKLAISKINEFYEEESNAIEMYGEKSMLLSKWKKRYLKAALTSRKKELVEDFIKDPAAFILPPKI